MKSEHGAGLADRVRSCAAIAGSGDALAEKAGIPRRTLENYLTGKSEPKATALYSIATAAGVTVDWLISGREPAQVRTAGSADFPSVPRYNVALSAGHGFFIERAEQLDSIPFTADFFTRRLGRGPKGLAIVDARGDSMEPTISDRDLVMIDTTDTQLTPAIWAFTLGDAVLVKRLQPTQAGIVQVASDNPAYAPFVIDRANADGFHLIGRVVWVGRVV